MALDRSAFELAATQGGVILRNQAVDLGFSPDQIRSRRESGEWTSIGARGYRLLTPASGIERARAAVTVLPSAVVSHETAGELHGIGRLWRGLAVVSVHTRTTHRFPDVLVRRNHDMLEEHITEIDGLPVTTVARTVVDMARFLTETHLCDILDDLMGARRIEKEELGAVIDAVARKGRPGSAVLGRVRDEYVSGVVVPSSVLERRGRALLERSGLPAATPEFPIPWSRSRRFDDAYVRERVAIEWDSRRWHMRQDAFDNDRRRDNEASVHGWTVYRFTWRDVSIRPRYVVDTIRRALARS